MKTKTILAAALTFAATALWAQIEIYDYPPEIPRSDKYGITIRQAGIQREAFVHFSECPEQENPREKILPILYDRTFSWTGFAMQGPPVLVTVKKLYGAPATSVEIAPKRYGIVPLAFDGQSVTFQLDRPEYVSVRFRCPENSDEYDQVRHGLMVFAEAPETDIPSPEGEGVAVYKKGVDFTRARTIVFEPGIHDLSAQLPNGMLPVHDNQEVYLAPGAFVYGGITGPSTYNVRVFGRGILCGVKQRFHYPGLPQLLELEPWDYRRNVHRGGNCSVEGITLLESFNHNLSVPPYSFVKDVKFIAWKVNNDGLRCGDGSVIDHVFMKVSDDHLYAFSRALICNSVFWPMWNGAILQLGWGNYGKKGTRFVNNDIINPEWNQWWWNNGVIASQVGPESRNGDILIQDLRVEGDINALANLHYRGGLDEQGPFSGHIKGITFRNVTVDGNIQWNNRQEGWYDSIPPDLDWSTGDVTPVVRGKSLIRGYRDEVGNMALVSDIVFENLQIGGQFITAENHADFFEVDESTTEDISFIRTENYDPFLAHTPGATRSDSYDLAGVGAGQYPMDFNDPSDPANYGWIFSNQSAAWEVDLPEGGIYDLKISIASGLAGASFRIMANGKQNTGVIGLKPITDNGYNLHKRISSAPLELEKGINTLVIRGLEGSCRPDYIEITPHDPDLEEPDVKVHSVSVMIIRGDTWVGAGLNIGVTPEFLQFNSRSGVVRNPDTRGPRDPLPVSEVSLYNRKGEQQILVRTHPEDLVRDIDIRRLPDGPYLAVFTDRKSFWVAKQFVK